MISLKAVEGPMHVSRGPVYLIDAEEAAKQGGLKKGETFLLDGRTVVAEDIQWPSSQLSIRKFYAVLVGE